MSSELKSNNYGKSGVRVLKVKRKGKIHEVIEMTVGVQFRGDFDDVHTKGDNSKVLPTDTIKNTVYVIAKKDPLNSPEEFCIHLGNYFNENNEQVFEVVINAELKKWKRIRVSEDAKAESVPHDHSFVSGGSEVRTCRVTLNSDIIEIRSGLKDLVVLKTTDSGFEGYIKDNFTTLPETDDRIFSTSIKADWKFTDLNPDFNKNFDTVRDILLNTFAGHLSPSVQSTLYECGRNVIEKCPDIQEITLSMPNKHYLKFNLEQFGLENKNEIFIPTDEPFGLIEGTVKRS
ncbi:MAG: urate oxidase [Bacteroidetes bacterium]|nr:urate oxidase [Bacteroidota bacterium]